MTIDRKGMAAAAILATIVGSTSFLQGAKAEPGAEGPGAHGDDSQGIIMVLLDRSGSMHDQGTGCVDASGNTLPVGTTERKWECAVNAALKAVNVNSADARYFLWAFGTVVGDPTNTQMVWSIDKNGNNVVSGGNTLLATVSDALALNSSEMKTALGALRSSGPNSNDAGTPLAGAYCRAIQQLMGYRGSYTDDTLTVLLESDGAENATPTGVTCQGIDAIAAGSTYAEGNPNFVELTASSVSGYIGLADGLIVPSWQTYMLDMAVTGQAHAPNPSNGLVPYTSADNTKAFVTQNGMGNIVTNINFITTFIPSVAALLVDGPSVDKPLVRFQTLAATASTTDPDLAIFKGLSDITGGRLITYGDGSTPAPGDPTAPHALPADVDNSGCVDLADYNILKQFYNQKVNPSQPNSYAADITYDGRIDINDYLMLKANYGKGCAKPPVAMPVLPQTILGFDDLTAWSSQQAPLTHVGLPRTEGDFAMSVGSTGFRTLNSIKFSTSNLQGITSNLGLDVAPAKKQTNKNWIGQVLMFASCPSAGVNNQIIGTVELAGKPLGTFSTVKFAIPQAVKNAMTTSHSDFSFSISVNANDPGYLLDNLRFVP